MNHQSYATQSDWSRDKESRASTLKMEIAHDEMNKAFETLNKQLDIVVASYKELRSHDECFSCRSELNDNMPDCECACHNN